MTLLDAAPDIAPVAAAADGEEAVRLAARHRPDVVLMDLRMPVLDGVEATRQIRAAQPETEIVVLTTHADEDSILDALRAGARGYLTKDAGIAEISRAVHAAAAHQAVLDPAAQSALIQAASAGARPGHRPPGSLPDELTPREAEVLSLIANGLSNGEIAVDARRLRGDGQDPHQPRVRQDRRPRPRPGGPLRLHPRARRMTDHALFDHAGDGPAVMLVHAGIADRRMWRPLPAMAGRRGLARHRTRSPRLRRARTVPGPSGAVGLPARSARRARVDRAVIVGNSFGGAVALRLAVTAPERVRGLVMISSPAPGMEPSPQLEQAWTAESEAMERGDIDGAVDAVVAAWLAPDAPAELRELVAAMQRRAFELDPEGTMPQPPDPVEETSRAGGRDRRAGPRRGRRVRHARLHVERAGAGRCPPPCLPSHHRRRRPSGAARGARCVPRASHRLPRRARRLNAGAGASGLGPRGARVGSLQRVDVDLGARAGTGRTPARQHVADLARARRSRRPADAVRPPRSRRLDVPSSPGERRQDADRGHVLEQPSSRVSIRLGVPASRCRRRACPARPGPAASAGRRPRSRRRSRRRRAAAAVPPRSRRRRSPSDRAKPSDGRAAPSRCTSAPAARANWATSRPIVPGPSTSTRSPGLQLGRPHGAQRVAARLDQRAERRRRRCRAARRSDVTGTASCSASAPGQPPRMPISYRSSQTCWRPDRQRWHRPQPSIVSPVTRRPSHAGSTPSPTAVTSPHHSWPSRIGYAACPSCR